jgi:hypothetical protein
MHRIPLQRQRTGDRAAKTAARAKMLAHINDELREPYLRRQVALVQAANSPLARLRWEHSTGRCEARCLKMNGAYQSKHGKNNTSKAA